MLFAFASVCAFAQPHEKLKLFEPLIGKNLVATITGTEMTDTQEFSWVYGGKFVRNIHYIQGPTGDRFYEGETMFGVDPESGEIVWWYWNSSGGYITGTWVEESEGTFVFEGKNHSNDPNQPKRTRGVAQNISAEGFTMTQYFWQNDTWVKRLTFDFKAQ
jgi:hypothetical protein